METLELKSAKAMGEKEFEELTEHSKSITNEKIEKSLNYDELTKAEQKAVVRVFGQSPGLFRHLPHLWIYGSQLQMDDEGIPA